MKDFLQNIFEKKEDTNNLGVAPPGLREVRAVFHIRRQSPYENKTKTFRSRSPSKRLIFVVGCV